MENNQYNNPYGGQYNGQYDNQNNGSYNGQNNSAYYDQNGSQYNGANGGSYNGTPSGSQQTPGQPEGPKKHHPVLWSVGTLAAAAVIALGCGYGGAYLANQEAGKVVIQSAAPAETEGAGDSGDTAAKAQNTAETNGALSGTEVAAKISPSVVSITTEQMEVGQFWFGPQVVSGAGSGVIISEDGYILTCAHVVSGADTITVILPDGTEYPGTVTGMYEEGDIAVVKIEATGLPAAVIGDSDQVQLGETVYAVGNPGGTLSGTITDGIISSVDRTINVSLEETSGYGWNTGRTVSLEVLQTSAAVSPGNSGGGLFNSRGELIGIVNAKSSGSSQEGLGFAIPVNRAMEIGESLINDGTYTDPNANMSDNDAILEITVTEINQASGRMQGVTPGVYVYEVQEGGASDGKLQVNDRMISVDGTIINTLEDLSDLLSEHQPGDTVSVSVERDGQMVTVDIVLAENTSQS